MSAPMTEQEWFATAYTSELWCSEPLAACSLRKMRLWACACCRLIWHLIPTERGRRAVEVAERVADGRATEEERAAAQAEAERAREELGPERGSMGWVDAEVMTAIEYTIAADLEDDPEGVSLHASRACRRFAAITDPKHTAPDRGNYDAGYGPPAIEAEEAACREHTILLREIVGNPFRPVAVATSWLTSEALALARGIYEEKAFDRMPILADALQDAGCDSDDVLDHCRGPGPHVRGCWVVDLVLGKE